MKLRRITVNADQMGGIPCIRALRIPVATVVGNKQHPGLESEPARTLISNLRLSWTGNAS